MTLTNIKTIRGQKGFTLVELLIVIVVIAILAAITIVAYNGVQNKAHTSASQSVASTVIKKAGLYKTENNSYPASLATMTGLADHNDPAYLSSGDVTDLTTAPTSTSKPSDDKSVYYQACSSDGAKATYWDFSKGQAATLTVGDTSAGC